MPERVAKPSSLPDPWQGLRALTPARIALGRSGGSIPTGPLLDFQLAHARARDAVQRELDGDALEAALREHHWQVLRLRSAAPDRRTFVQRPDLGRILSDESKAALESRGQPAHDLVLIIADGLSALAIERHAVAVLEALRPRLDGWRIAPVCVVHQGRVAIGDEIGTLLGADLAVVLIGERPGLSAPDSLGVYLTWDPSPGRTNAERNCISNIRPEGLGYALAAHKLYHLMTAARLARLTGIDLKEDAPALPGEHA